MVRMNDYTKRVTSIDECGQDSSRFVVHRKELPGLFALDSNLTSKPLHGLLNGNAASTFLMIRRLQIVVGVTTRA